MHKLGRRLAGAQQDYDELVGVRRRALERRLDRLDELRRRRGLDAHVDAPADRLAEPAAAPAFLVRPHE